MEEGRGIGNRENKWRKGEEIKRKEEREKERERERERENNN